MVSSVDWFLSGWTFLIPNLTEHMGRISSAVLAGAKNEVILSQGHLYRQPNWFQPTVNAPNVLLVDWA